MSEWQAKRFWKSVALKASADGFAVLLDERQVRTPAKTPLIVPTEAMASAIAAEWQAQEGIIDPLSMPVTRSANAALDKVAVQQWEVADLVSAYGETDLLCYRAEGPVGLVERQSQLWDPLLEWAHETFGARLSAIEGVMYIAQSEDALQKLASPVKEMSPFELAGFHDLVSISGSLVLGLAVIQGRLEPDEAWDLSRLDEDWQIEQWGPDDEAEEVAQRKKQDFVSAANFYALARL